MPTTLAVARREFSSFFNSAIAYIVLAAFLLVAGWIYFSPLFLTGQASLRGFFSFAPLLFVVFAPAVTMRLIAEERKAGTLELLLTFPVSDWQVVLGKFLAALAMVGVGLAWTLPYAFSVAGLTVPGVSFDWGATMAGYLGLLLMASAFLSLGLWASALSKNQIIGFIVGLIICFGFYIVDKFALLFPDAIAGLLQYLSVDYHFENIARGVIDPRDVLFYLSITVVGLAMTTLQLSTVRK